jgi:hypothetical protein
LATDGTGTVSVIPWVGAGSPPQTDLILDVDGYFSEDITPAPGAQGPYGYQTVPLCRLYDTRSTNDPISAGSIRSFNVDGLCGVPAGAAAAALNLLAMNTTTSDWSGFILFPAGAAFPPTSTLNFVPGTVGLANGARTRLAGAGQDVSLYYYGTPGSTTHVILDTYGYFSSTAPLKYHPITSCRAVDTRNWDPPALAANQVRSFQIQGNCGVPRGAKAALVNIVAWTPSGFGWMIPFASGSPLPGGSILDYDPMQAPAANGTIVPLSTNADDLSIYAGATGVHLFIDVYGYFQ